MAFPASQQTLDSGLSEASSIANSLKAQTQALRNQSALGNTSRQSYLNLLASLASGVSRWNAIAAIAGMQAYAQSQYGSGTLDISTEFTNMKNAAASLRDWIFNNFPKDAGSGAVLLMSVNVSGVQTMLEFTSAQVAGFRTLADAFVATVA